MRRLLLLFLLLTVVKGAALDAQSLWIDEGHTWHDAVAGNILHPEGTTPLWTAVSVLALHLGAMLPVETALRLPSLLCGLAALAVLAFAFPFPRSASRLWILLLTGLHPLLYWHDRDARMYSLLFLCASVIVTVIARRLDGRHAPFALAFLAAVIGTYAHPFLLALLGPLTLWLWWQPVLLSRRALVGAVLCFVLCLLPLLAVYGETLLRFGTPTAPPPFAERLTGAVHAGAQALFGYSAFSRRHFPLWTAVGLPLCTAILLVLVVRGLRTPSSARALFVATSLAPALLTLCAGAAGAVFVMPRYFIICLPALLALLACLPAARSTRLMLLLLIAVFAFGSSTAATDPRFAREDWRGLAALMQETVAAGGEAGFIGAPPHVYRLYQQAAPAVADSTAWLDTAPPGTRLLVLYHAYRRLAVPLRDDPRYRVRDWSRFVLVTLDANTAGAV